MREILFFLIFNFSSGLIPTLENLNDRLKKLQWKNDEFEPKIKNLEETNHELKLKVKHLEEKNEEFEPEIKNLKETNHELKLKVKHSESKIKNLEEKVKTLEEINREFESQIGPKGPKGVVEDVEYVLVEQKKLSEVSHVNYY